MCKLSKYVCSICGYVYDEEKGIPEANIAPGTRWEDLPDNWVCPLCGAAKEMFVKKEEEDAEASIDTTPEPAPQGKEDGEYSSPSVKELSYGELSVICSNLARGCEKQYLSEESELFSRLAKYFKDKDVPIEETAANKLMELVEKDLSQGYPNANRVSSGQEDRGALRALVWSEKVSRMLQSILSRYNKEGDALFANTGVYICTICGFVFVGDQLPDICPVCKVTNRKFEKVAGR